jgi:hypothetical protein
MGLNVLESLTRDEKQVIAKVATEAHVQSWGIASGALAGFGLLFATEFLVFKGGDSVGPHLGLLSVYLPGYSVTFVGGLVGFVYAFVIGYGIGRSIVTIYNHLNAKMR